MAYILAQLRPAAIRMPKRYTVLVLIAPGEAAAFFIAI
jgi:hypothetical protein